MILSRFSRSALLATILLFLIQISCGVTVSPAANASTSTPANVLGNTRSNPAPVGSTIVDTNRITIAVNFVIRPGEPAILPSSISSKITADEEHILINLSVTCTKSKDDQCFFSPDFNLKVVGSQDIEDRITDAWANLSVEKLETKSFYGGNTITGYVPFIVKKGDNEILLIYSGDSEHYLLLPQGKPLGH